ncbi:MAG: hypothetical protein PHO90_01750 [Candidatus Pacebacteria bacterium]|nr:hypothetical protein [Candidatus Paceibacterota bacterium]
MIGIFENINATKFPTLHPKFSVVTGIQGDVGEHDQSLVIINQQTGKEISRVIGKSKIPTPDTKAVFIGNFVMITIPTPGKYTVNVLVDGSKIGYIEFNAQQLT